MTDQTKALPCPFCGSAARMRIDALRGSAYKLYQIDCNDSKCPTNPCTNWLPREEALRLWNQRASETTAVDQVGDSGRTG